MTLDGNYWFTVGTAVGDENIPVIVRMHEVWSRHPEGGWKYEGLLKNLARRLFPRDPYHKTAPQHSKNCTL